MSKYVDWKKKIQGNDVEKDQRHTDGTEEGEHVSNAECPTENRVELIEGHGEKIGGYQSDYIDSLDPGSYIDASSGSDADDAQCKKIKHGKVLLPHCQL